MNGIYQRIRGVGARTWRAVVQVRVPGGRARVMVAAVVATVLATGAGVAWGLASTGDEPPGAAGGSRFPAPGGTPGGFGDGGASLGPLGGAGNPPGGGGPGGFGSGSGSGAGSGAGSGSGLGDAGGGPAGNRPPVIEDAGLSSDGMTLTIAPTVTDPDGDPVEVGYDDGNEFALVTEEPTRTYPAGDSAGGYRYPVEVTIHATDVHGAAAQETFTHQLEAVSTVVVRRIELRLESPRSCFANSEAERFTATLALRGAVVLDRRISEELRPDKPAATLLPAPVEGEVTGAPPRQDLFLIDATLAGEVGSLNLPDLESPVRPRRMFLDSRCQANVRVSVQITTR